MNSKLGESYVLVIDEGTSGTKGLVFDNQYRLRGSGYRDLKTFSDPTGKAEMDANDIWTKTVAACRDAIEEAQIDPVDIACMGVTNQRTTLVVWDRETGEPLHNVINWQDSRISLYNEQFSKDGMLNYFGNFHGKMEPMYGIVFLRWLITNVPLIAAKVKSGEAICGSVDAWLLFKLTNGSCVAASYDNAATIGYIRGFDLKISTPLLDYLEMPAEVFPEARENDEIYGYTDPALFGVRIPITGVIADQHASMFVQGLLDKGTCKCTNGTGSFYDINIGHDFIPAQKEYSVFLTWVLNQTPSFVAEGTILCTGTFLRWVKNNLMMYSDYKEIDRLAEEASSSFSLLVIPMLYGMLYPRADRSIRAAFMGASEEADRAHLARAILEGISFSILVSAEALQETLSLRPKEIKVDGGITQSDIFCRIMNESFGMPIKRSRSFNLTALGAAHMALIGAGINKYEAITDVIQYHSFDAYPSRSPDMEKTYNRWLIGLERCADWNF